jgi:hypothetical protein
MAVTGASAHGGHRIFGGSEPSDPEVYAFVLRDLFPLMDRVRGAATNAAATGAARTVNPKRMVREAEAERKRLLRRAQAKQRHRGH